MEISQHHTGRRGGDQKTAINIFGHCHATAEDIRKRPAQAACRREDCETVRGGGHKTVRQAEVQAAIQDRRPANGNKVINVRPTARAVSLGGAAEINGQYRRRVGHGVFASDCQLARQAGHRTGCQRDPALHGHGSS